jgi:aminopeptidase N
MIKTFIKLTAVTVLSLGLMACDNSADTSSKSSENAAVASERAISDNLLETRAIERKARVLEASYDLSIDITDKDNGLEGSTVLTFVLKGADEPLTIDFSGGTVMAISLNGKSIDVDYNGFFITLPASVLAEGANKAVIHYTHPYGKDGTGLHHFKDPEDGKTYLYTQLWPNYSNRVFPSFDQPNIKAEITMTVDAPKNWRVISTTKETGVKEGEVSNVWSFPATPKMSTYIFSLHAGPYAMWEDVAKTAAGDIPIRLFSRDSLKENVAVDHWFDVTKKGLVFFGDYFDYPYAFKKYDQLIVPDFNVGAMENLAAVTYRESFVSRGEPTQQQKEGWASTILHEMAHMWFGDLVTMDWWNGMWLNESFATYMAAIAQENITDRTDIWQSFFLSAKASAYKADAKVSTHPIEGPVPSTAAIFTVFDSITYGKGASALNQLSHYAGPEKFRLGVSGYLKKHSYGNTTLKDFIAGVSEATEEDLSAWSKSWLYQSGFNTIKAEVACEANKITKLTIHQKAPEDHNYLRSHKLQVGLYGVNEMGTPVLSDTITVQISGAASDVPEAVGKACPAVMNPNHGDWSYAKVTLDDASLAALKGKISGIDDKLARSMFWYSLYTMALSGEMPMGTFVDQVQGDIEGEKNLKVIIQVNGYLKDVMDRMNRLTPEMDGELYRVTPALEALSWKLMMASEPRSELQKSWFDHYRVILGSDDGLERLEGLLNGFVTIPGLLMNTDTRWGIIITLSVHGVVGARDLIAAELERDGSDFSQKQAIRAEASLPEIIVKTKWINEVTDPNSKLGFAKHRDAMEYLFPSQQTALQLDVFNEIVDALPKIGKTHDQFFLGSYGDSMLGPVCDVKSVEKLEQALKNEDQIHPVTLKRLQAAHQADVICVGIKMALQKANPQPRR